MSRKPAPVGELPAKFVARLDLSKAVTPRLIPKHAIHNWFSFPHSYSPELVEAILVTWGLRPGEWLLDPFVGAGTTLRCAKERGVLAWGTDLSPLAVLVSNAKVADYDPAELRTVLGNLKSDWQRVESALRHAEPARPDDRVLWVESERLNKAFLQSETRVLHALRDQIMGLDDVSRDFFWVALLSVLPDFSRAVADGGWFRWVERPDQADAIAERVWTRAGEMLADLAEDLAQDDGELQRPQAWGAEILDARELDRLAPKTFDGLITSPPYPNRHDYSRVFQLELLTMGSSEKDIFALRHDSLRSHVEARPPAGSRARHSAGYQAPALLVQKLSELPRDIDRRVRPMMEGYFEDMYLVLAAAHKVLAPSAPVALVVGNVRHGGVLFPVDEILVSLGEQAGYQHTRSWVVRMRGNSAQQMKAFGREPSRETVVFLKRVQGDAGT